MYNAGNWQLLGDKRQLTNGFVERKLSLTRKLLEIVYPKNNRPAAAGTPFSAETAIFSALISHFHISHYCWMNVRETADFYREPEISIEERRTDSVRF
jgi:hypothetical protein